MELLNTLESKQQDKSKLLKNLDGKLDKLKVSADVASSEFYQALVELDTLITETLPRRNRVWLGDRMVSTFDLNSIFSRVWNGAPQKSDISSEESDCKISNSACAVLLCSLANLTDVSDKICKYLGETGVLHDLLQGLERGNLPQADVSYVILIIYNSCWRVRENRVLCRGYINVLQDLSETTNPELQADVFLALSYIVDESDYHKLALSKSCVKFLLDVLSEALDSPSKTSPTRLYSALEVIQGIHQLSLNDNNKRMIVDFDGITVLERVIFDHILSDREKEFAAKAIWQLGFIDKHKAVIRERSTLIERLKLLKETSASQELQEACSGVLFVVNDIDKYRPKEDSHGGSLVKPGLKGDQAHIMISYQHSSQATMIRVKEYLERNGYNVWMDVDRMAKLYRFGHCYLIPFNPEGDILEAMASAVEKSAVVLVCMSREFKESHNCRTEATYAFTLNKEIIPLKLQEGYTPDGWLGALMGMNLYYPMYSQEHMDTNLPQLIGVLGNKGKLESHVVPERIQEVGNKPRASPTSNDRPASRSARKIHPLPQHPKVEPLQSEDVESWSHDQVHDWLKSIGVDRTPTWKNSKKKLQKLTGVRISQIRSLLDRAPEYCVKALEKELGLSFWDVLSFVSALKHIQSHE